MENEYTYFRIDNFRNNDIIIRAKRQRPFHVIMTL